MLNWQLGCIHIVFQMRQSGWISAALLLLAACSRSGLALEDGESSGGAGGFSGNAPLDPDAAGLGGAATVCTPSEELCNGNDDDCDGQVDEIPAVPCEEGGFSYCVAGQMSACPDRCETCLPGSERICFLSYCKYWAIQTCTADGRSFGKCHEQDPPPECESIAKKKKYSKELEQCCIDNGYCCVDEFDLDNDGVTGDLVGQCDEVLCGP